VVVVVLPELPEVLVVVSELEGGVTTTVLDLPGSPLGPSGPGAPGGPGTGTVVVAGGVLTTGGLVTTVGRSQAISPIEAKRVASSSEYFISFS